MVVAVGDVCLDGPGGPGEEPDEQHAAGGRGEEGAGQRVHTPHHQKVSRVAQPSLCSGLRIRSIFGRIRLRILQIRILKLDPDPGSRFLLALKESIQTSKFFSHQTYFYSYLNDDYFYLKKWKNSPENV